MNINQILWIATIATVESLEVQKMFPGSQSISSGRYQIFVPTKQIHSMTTAEECNKFHGEPVLNPPQGIQKIISNLIKPMKTMIGFDRSLCQFRGVVLLDKNIVKLFDNQVYQYNKGYFYNGDKTEAFWDNSNFEFLLVFRGNLELWEIELFQPPATFRIFSHKTLNLTLRIEKELKINGEIIYSTSIEDLFVKSIVEVNPVDEYFDEHTIYKYFGKLTNRTEPVEIYVQTETPVSRNTTRRKCIKHKTTNSSLVQPQEYVMADSDDDLNWNVMIVLLISATGNCIGIICMMMYCYKNVYFITTKPQLVLEMTATYPDCRKSNDFIEDNDLYNQSVS